MSAILSLLAAYGITPSGTPMKEVKVGDFEKDFDDTNAAVASAGLQHAGLIEVDACIGVLNPAMHRARAAKGAFAHLGLDIPTGVGSDITMEEGAFPYELAVDYLADESEIVDGTNLLRQTLLDAEDHSLVIMIQAGMTDVADLMERNPNLFAQKVSFVAIMGGIEVDKTMEDGKLVDVQVHLDDDGYMIPDTAANNEFDQDAAKTVYLGCQKLGVPMLVLTREAAYACQIPLGIAYSGMADTGSPIGKRMLEGQAPALRILWDRCNAPEGSELRGKLPMRCDRAWFVETFCLGNDPGDVDDIWPKIEAGQLYDPMTVLAAVPEIRERFFDPTEIEIDGTLHLIVGMDRNLNSGIADPDGLRQFLMDLLIKTLEEYQVS